ncbi:MAG: NAD(P)H-dependent oxidoreductase [Pseudomonadota bacterium]
MRALVLYCHPREGSFNAAVRDVVLAHLELAGAEVRLHDLYARRFEPALSASEHAGYLDVPSNRAAVESEAADLEWCDTLIFVYPTWWYGLPAVLKGWLDRVMIPDVAFKMPCAGHNGIRPGLTHIRRLGVFTTCGASWWLTTFIGAPGRRTLMRGVGMMCARPLRTAFAAHYNMDTSTQESRARHLARVERKLARLLGTAPRRAAQEVAA